MVIDQWSSLRPNALTRPRKAPARSIHSSTEEQHYVFFQTVTHSSNNAANCCLSLIVVTLASEDLENVRSMTNVVISSLTVCESPTIPSQGE